MIENWQLLKERKMFEAVPFNVLRRDYLRPDKKGEFNAFVLQMPDWVNIIAYNTKNEVLLIRQFRFGSSNVELEIPGGCIEEGEEPLAAAKRELKEETGYEGDDWEFLGVVDSNPAV
ncbi:MAG: NUDIX hydrolase, partial [Promethearchaeota archaeon]